jgi:quercetin dioxygenase-like cupin family protein
MTTKIEQKKVKRGMGFWAFVLLFSLGPVSTFGQGLDPKKFDHILTQDLVFKPASGYPAGAEMAFVVGTPTEEGPFVVRVRLADGTKFMPHIHQEDRIYTVISGVFWIGLGEVFDEDKLMAFAPGSVVVLPGGQPHFHHARSGEYVTQVNAIGPLGLDYIDPASDPRSQG